MWESLFKLVLEVIDAEKILEPDINRNVKFMPFLYHGSHLGFQGIIEREKMAPYFFLMFISYSNRIRRVFAFTKKNTRMCIS